MTIREAELRHLRRLRWAVRGVLALGVAASIAANVLHARPNPVSQVISAWPPLALMLTVELISRVPTHQRMLAVLRLIAAAPIAGIAAWVSYWHMVGVAARYGETEAAAAYLLPLSVDGLVVVASVSLVEITGRLRAAPRSLSATLASSAHSPPPADANPVVSAPAPPPARPAPNSGQTPLRRPHDGPATEPNRPDAVADDGAPVPRDTAAAVTYWYRRDPHLHPADIAARIGRSERTVRRYWPPPGASAPTSADKAGSLVGNRRP
ncbi:DUF2637 domain-containing protein [Micromonospora sp. RHAY321]|uniref:DUF2637 domain-containing protein n=1 Tax=Micromonospora sp. RHAY321 TaxID=2944807 RepID=UPI00207C96CC|nr:DUF2637 domain-containing protein [Micromonospora sp. RHAY321]MCO1593779.1 DUF2637 domain-containing protein [Micromonospora sp. RHAY321]